MFADRLVFQLKESGIRSWIDRIELKGGDSLISKLSTAVATSGFVLAILSPNSINSRWVRKELEMAMTVEVEENRRSVIPLLYKTCELPPFLKSKLYIDFRSRSPRKANEALQQLLLALDNPDSSLQESPIFGRDPAISRTLTKQLADLTGGKDQRWLRHFKRLPLVRFFDEALKVQTFSGDIVGLLRLEMVRVSHSRDARAANGFLALAGFVADVVRLRLTSPDICTLVRRIAEDANIHTGYRGQIIRRLPELYNGVSSRHVRMLLLPNIFGPHSFDPLSDELVKEFSSASRLNTSAKLAGLWRLNVPSYRQEIVQYIIATSHWKDAPPPSEEIHLSKRPEDLFRLFKPHWAGLWGDNVDEERVSREQEWLERAIVKPDLDIDRVLRVSQLLFRAGSEAAINAVSAIFDKRIIEELIRNNGNANTFKVLVRILVSAYLDWTSAALAFIEIVHKFGIAALRCDSRFPAALLVPRENRVLTDGTPEVSILDGLVDAAKDGDTFFVFLMKGLLTSFPQMPFVAAVVEARKKASDTSPHLNSIVEFALRFEFVMEKDKA